MTTVEVNVEQDLDTVRSQTARKEAVVYCILVFAVSWGWWGLRLLPAWQIEHAIDRSQVGALDVQVGMFAPLVVALVMRLWIFKEGLSGTVGLRRSWRVYAAAYFLPLLLGIIAVTFNHFSGLARFDWAGDSPFRVAGTILLVSLPAILTAFGEEYGWRGYLLPRLLVWGDVWGTLGMGLIWGFWHLPLVVFGLTYPGEAVGVGVLVFVSSTVMLSFFFTAFHYLSAGSAAVAAVIHGVVNVLSELSSPNYVAAGSPFVTNPLGISTAMLLFAAGIVLLRIRQSGWWGRLRA